MIFVFFLGLTTFIVISLASFHSWLAASNTTTYEYIKADHFSRNSAASLTRFDEGFVKNCTTFFQAPVKLEWTVQHGDLFREQ